MIWFIINELLIFSAVGRANRSLYRSQLGLMNCKLGWMRFRDKNMFHGMTVFVLWHDILCHAMENCWHVKISRTIWTQQIGSMRFLPLLEHDKIKINKLFTPQLSYPSPWQLHFPQYDKNTAHAPTQHNWWFHCFDWRSKRFCKFPCPSHLWRLK